MNAILSITVAATILSSPFLLSRAPSEPGAAPADKGPRRQGLPSLAWADFDGDGLQDLLTVHAEGASLFRGSAGDRMEDCTLQAGLSLLPYVSSATWIDYDGDEALDIFLLTTAGAPVLLRNATDGTFQEVTLTAEIPDAAPMLRAQWSDLDEDGHLDLMAWTSEGVSVSRNRRDGTFATSRLELPAGAVQGSPGNLFTVGRGSTDEASPLASGASGASAAMTLGHTEGGRRRLPALESSGATAGRTVLGPGSGGGATGEDLSVPATWELIEGPAGFCAKTLRDQATGNCLSASTVPALGQLYPQSLDLNVSASNGFVGMGTTAPTARLDVTSSGSTTLRASSTQVAALLSTTSRGYPALNVRANGHMAAFLEGSLEVGYVTGVPPLLIPSPRVTFDVDTSSAGYGEYRASNNRPTVLVQAEEVNGDGGQITISNIAGTPTIFLDGDTGVSAGQIALNNSSGVETIEIDAEEVAGNGAQIVLRKADGTASIVLDAEQGGDGRITTEVLAITGGADLVESFDTGSITCEPGSVVVIDPDRPGELTLSSRPYDTRVAGVVSGAGDVRPGLHMGQTGVASGSTLVALTGRVYVSCSAENGAIRPGDLLTTSSVAGEAMRATDSGRAFGAVIGKAMTALDEESGLVLVLVNLQ